MLLLEQEVLLLKNAPDNEIGARIPAKKICIIDEYIQNNENNFHNTVGMDAKKKRNIIQIFIRINKFYSLKKI